MQKNKLLLIALVMTTVYLIANGMQYFQYVYSEDVVEQISAFLAGLIVGPHFILVVLGLVFNALAYFQHSKAFALTSGILYAVSAVLFLLSYYMVLIPSILCFVAYANMDKHQVTRKDLSIYQSHHYKSEVDEKNYQEAKQYFSNQRKRNVYQSRTFSTKDYAMNRTIKSMFKGAQYLFGALIVFSSLGQATSTSKILLGIMFGISMFPLTFDLIAEYNYMHRDDLIKYEVMYFFLVIILIANLF